MTVNGKPAQGIVVIASPSESDPSRMIQSMFGRLNLFKTTTDHDGQYRLTAIPEGKYSVKVFAPTHSQDRTDFAAYFGLWCAYARAQPAKK